MFDLSRLEKNRYIHKISTDKSPFYQFICTDLIDRLQPLANKFSKILLISLVLEHKLRNLLEDQYNECNITTKKIHELQPQTQKFDLIILPFAMHWVKDIQTFLSLLSSLLIPNGVLIANFAGGRTLNHLRSTLLELELQFTNQHYAHILPFIKFEHMTPLLQRAGFAENIIDLETIELEYTNALSLMKAIKSHGESNKAASSISYSINKEMYDSLQQDTPFIDSIDLITLLSSPTKNSITLHKNKFD